MTDTNTAWTEPGYVVRMPDQVHYKVINSIYVDGILTVVFAPLPAHNTVEHGPATFVKDKDSSADEWVNIQKLDGG